MNVSRSIYFREVKNPDYLHKSSQTRLRVPVFVYICKIFILGFSLRSLFYYIYEHLLVCLVHVSDSRRWRVVPADLDSMEMGRCLGKTPHIPRVGFTVFCQVKNTCRKIWTVLLVLFKIIYLV